MNAEKEKCQRCGKKLVKLDCCEGCYEPHECIVPSPIHQEPSPKGQMCETNRCKCIRLKFMVDPDWLKEKTYIENPVRVVVTDPEAIFLSGILGESGRSMVLAGFPFYFEKELAEKLISKGICTFFPKSDGSNTSFAEGAGPKSWYCRACAEWVPPTQVTYDECHDIRCGGCGGPVEISDHGSKRLYEDGYRQGRASLAQELETVKADKEKLGEMVKDQVVRAVCAEKERDRYAKELRFFMQIEDGEYDAESCVKTALKRFRAALTQDKE